MSFHEGNRTVLRVEFAISFESSEKEEGQRTYDRHLRISIVFEYVEIVQSVRIGISSFSSSAKIEPRQYTAFHSKRQSRSSPCLFEAKRGSVLRNTVNVFVTGKSDVETERFRTYQNSQHQSQLIKGLS